MPVRSLTSSVLKWPDAKDVHHAVQRWATVQAQRAASLVKVGYIGSYARSDWGVGSDVDLILIVTESGEPFTRRGIAWDTAELPVPADVLVYTQAEWNAMADQATPFYRTVEREAVWVLGEPAGNDRAE